MKLDAVNGGIKVFSDKDSGDPTDDRELVARPSRTGGAGPERRKRWQPDAERVPLQIRKSGSGAAAAGARLRPSKSLGDVGGGRDEEEEEEGGDEGEEEEEEIEMVDVKEVDANSKSPQIVAQPQPQPQQQPPQEQQQEPQEQQQEGAISVASIAKEMDSKDAKLEPENVAEDEKPLPLPAIRKKLANAVVEEKPRVSHRKKPTSPAPEKKPLLPTPKIEHPTVDPDLPKPPPSTQICANSLCCQCRFL